jgi:uncharacterized protein
MKDAVSAGIRGMMMQKEQSPAGRRGGIFFRRTGTGLAAFLLCLISGGMPVSAGTQAAEVDCQKPGQSSELMVCRNHWLSERNTELNTTYELLWLSLPRAGRDRLERAERAWKQEMETCRSDVLCLATEYTGHIATLRDQYRTRIDWLKGGG